MLKVYVVNWNPKHDYEAAKDWGELVFMTKGYIRDEDVDATRKVFMEYFSNIQPNDFVLLSGSAIICAIAVSVWVELYANSDRLLRLLYRSGSKDNGEAQYKLYEA